MMFPFLFEIFFILVLSRLSVCVCVCVCVCTYIYNPREVGVKQVKNSSHFRNLDLK